MQLAGCRASNREEFLAFQQLFRGGEPLCPRIGPPSAALVDRQQRIDDCGYLIAGGKMRHAGIGAERSFVERIESGKRARKQFAVNHTLSEASCKPEVKFPGKLTKLPTKSPFHSRAQ